MTILRQLILLVAIVLFVENLSAQVEWSQPQVEHIEGESYRLSLTAHIEQGWKIYDLERYQDGPNPTTWSFELPEGITLEGEVQSLTPSTKKWDAIFAQEIGSYHDEVTFVQDIRATRGGEVVATVEWMACSDMSCTPPSDESFTITIDPPKGASSSLWMVLMEAILWGFAALLTPCVFPMVPMTISFFMKGSDEGRGRLGALLYGLFIVALYTLPIALLIAVTRLFGGDSVTADIFNWIATHWLPNLIFFAVFMLFAASFFGAFEISLPSKWVNASDRRGDKSSIGGIFFLALTLVLVSFSCTGPIVGSVLIKSLSGEVWQPIVTMVAFSVAFALPFMLVALSPSLVQRMPRSGGWISSVKIVLGFVELALGLKFLSVADQTYHWGILPREIYLAIWIVLFSLLGLYLLGKIRFKDEERVERIGFGRLISSIAVFSFVIYLLPGMWGAPLKPLAGYLPPPTSSAVVSVQSSEELSSQGSIMGLNIFYDIDEGQEYANSVGKPLMIDFTGHGCVNCREMEQRVWSDPRVMEILRDDYIIVALYMDGKEQLPESKWLTTPSGRVLKSAGRVNSALALERFGVNIQPYYILLGRDGEELTTPRGYNLDVEAYIDFLERGLRSYNRAK